MVQPAVVKYAQNLKDYLISPISTPVHTEHAACDSSSIIIIFYKN